MDKSSKCIFRFTSVTFFKSVTLPKTACNIEMNSVDKVPKAQGTPWKLAYHGTRKLFFLISLL